VTNFLRSRRTQFATPLEFDAGLIDEYGVPAAVVRSTTTMMYEVYQGNPTTDSLDICHEVRRRYTWCRQVYSRLTTTTLLHCI